MIEMWLRRFAESPSRRLIVIGVTFVIGLTVGWPAVDDYFALRERSDRETAALASARVLATNLPKAEEAAARQATRLTGLDAKLADERGLNEFRAWVVDQIRQSGCQMRKVRVGVSGSRHWHEDDDPVESVGNTGPETPFTLKTILMNVSASGSMANVKDLLARLDKAEKLVYTKRFHMRPEGQDGKEVVLELDWVLFDLQETENRA